MRTTRIIVTIIVFATLVPSCSRDSGPARNSMSFDGSSGGLARTQIVPTLETPIEKGKNAIWCASFQCAWKALQENLAVEPVMLDGADATVASLNDAPDLRAEIPEACLYTAAGWKPDGIIDKIHADLKKQFPGKQPPVFPGIVDNSFVAYSYLEANVTFTLPYFQSQEPLTFTDSEGRKTDIESFGIRPEDDYAYGKLRAQPRVLFCKGDMFSSEGHMSSSELEFAVDLCADSAPSQIVVARIEREETLAAAIARVEMETSDWSPLEGLGPNDVLLVPDFFWQISHRFSELEKKPFKNEKLKGQSLDVAQQDILFRLDRSGAMLESEAKMYCLPVPTYYTLDRPFLIYMKKRGANSPYFAMWVDNTELLQVRNAEDSQKEPQGAD